LVISTRAVEDAVLGVNCTVILEIVSVPESVMKVKALVVVADVPGAMVTAAGSLPDPSVVVKVPG